MKQVLTIAVAVMCTVACKRDPGPGISQQIRERFKQPEMQFPANNLPSAERIALGKYLFFNPVMSADSLLSCASCHHQQFAFADNRATSPGVFMRPGTRNSPSLANIGYHPYFTREGGVPSLEQQVLIPIQEHNEFNSNILDIADRLSGDLYFTDLAEKAYPGKPLYFAISSGLAAFERTLISNQSKFDAVLRGDAVFTREEAQGFTLFRSPRVGCIRCHNGFNFTNYGFYSNGGTPLRDSGKFRLSRKSSDIGLFKVPGLRNVALTAPYMHDGSVPHLRMVLQRYNHGGCTTPNKDRGIKPLHLTEDELTQLEAFLHTLTDMRFVRNPNFKP